MIVEKHRDLSQLSTLLAAKAVAPAEAHIETPKASAGVARIRKAANDNKPARSLLAWPALERLAHRGDKARLYALRHWRDLNFPREIVVAGDGETYDPELQVEIRPSEAELLGAVGWKAIGRERWAHTGEMVNVYEPAPDEAPALRTNRNGVAEATLGDLVFRGGELLQWGTTKKGAALRPVERSRDAKGGTEPGRTQAAIMDYLSLKGAVSPLTAEPYSKPLSGEPALHCCYNPLPREEPNSKDKLGRYGAQEARELLIELGVDGSVRFEDLPVGASRCPVGYAAGALWLGGVKEPKPTASEPAGREPEFVGQVEMIDYVEQLRIRLRDHAKVLDLAITDTSARDIGIAMGLAPAYAEKRGTSLIEAALDALIDIDETARADFVSSSVPRQKIAA